MNIKYRANFLHYNHLLSLICCLIFNKLLILCLHVEKLQQFRPYRSVLYLQCCADMLAGTLYYLTPVIITVMDGTFYFCILDQKEEFKYWFGYQIEISYIVFYGYLFAAYLGLLFVPLNFYYRLQQLC